MALAVGEVQCCGLWLVPYDQKATACLCTDTEANKGKSAGLVTVSGTEASFEWRAVLAVLCGVCCGC